MQPPLFPQRLFPIKEQQNHYLFFHKRQIGKLLTTDTTLLITCKSMTIYRSSKSNLLEKSPFKQEMIDFTTNLSTFLPTQGRDTFYLSSV